MIRQASTWICDFCGREDKYDAPPSSGVAHLDGWRDLQLPVTRMTVQCCARCSRIVEDGINGWLNTGRRDEETK